MYVEAKDLHTKHWEIASNLASIFLRVIGATKEEEVGIRKEWSHFDHNSNSPHYNSLENGAWLTIKEHYQLHYKFHKRAMENQLHGEIGNGLNRSQNIQALGLIWIRMNDREKKGLISPPTKRNFDNELLDQMG